MWRNFNIKLVFKSFKIKTYFSYKDPIPDDLKIFPSIQITCASCSSSYISETCHHFKTKTEDHVKKDNKSHIFKHRHSTTTCFNSYKSFSLKIIDKANSKFDLKIKEAVHINWTKPNLKSLVTIRMNEIFRCLACYGQKFIFCLGIKTKINTSSVKGSSEDKIGTTF